MRARTLLAAVTALATATPAAAQPLDPYGDDAKQEEPPPAEPPADPPAEPRAEPDEPPAPPDSAHSGQDPELDEAIAVALVARARELIAQEEYVDAQQLLGEALVRSPDGPAARDARVLLDQVNTMLGITPTASRPPDPIDRIDRVDTIDPVQVSDKEMPEPGAPAPGGRRFMWHAMVIGGFIGGFLGDAASADVEPFEVDGDDVDTEDSGAIVGGVLLGGLAGLAVGAGFRRSAWMTRDDVVVIDSFTAMGMVGALSMGALMKPAEGEAYSVNAIIGTAGGLITGLTIAKRRDISARRMGRVDLFAAAGAVAPWLIFAAADGNASGAQVAGFFSMAGMVGGAWLGFRTTRSWDEARLARGPNLDAPVALVRRDAAGAWGFGAPGLRPVNDPVLGPVLGKGFAADVVGVRW